MYFARNKCSLSRNGTFCRHETTCSARDVVQTSVLKAFFAWKKHLLNGFRCKQACTDGILRREMTS